MARLGDRLTRGQRPRISVLDQSIAAAGRPQAAAIRDTAAMARHCDRLGYHRFWVSEHHNNPTIVGTAPEILIAAIAVQTERIRVGSAGVMLPHYAPFKVAEQFRVLDALAPGRIDSASVARQVRRAHRLRPQSAGQPAAGGVSQRYRRSRRLAAWRAAGRTCSKPDVRGRRHRPGAVDLGSSLTARRSPPISACPTPSLGFSPTARAVNRPSTSIDRNINRAPATPGPTPRSASGPWPPTAAKRRNSISPGALAIVPRPRRVHRPGGAGKPSPTPTTPAKRRRWRPAARAMIGTGDEVAAKIRARRRDRRHEVAVVTWCYDEAVRQRSHQLLAAAFDLEGHASAGLAALRHRRARRPLTHDIRALQFFAKNSDSLVRSLALGISSRFS